MPFQSLTWLTVLLILVPTKPKVAAHSVTPSDLAKPDCQSTCGNQTIPFPFGIKSGCYLADKLDSFYVTCINDTLLFLGDSKDKFRITNISLQHSQIEVLSFIGHACFNESVLQTGSQVNVLLNHPRFPISYTSNKFKSVGCSTLAITEGDETIAHENTTGCKSARNYSSNIKTDSCSGIGYCQASMPIGIRRFKATVTSPVTGISTTKLVSCAYSFLVEENVYDVHERIPVVLDWAIGNETCEKAKQRQSSYACVASNSTCVNLANGPGYSCSCLSGFAGNPYIAGGCKDIDECEEEENLCTEENKICQNLPGSYLCSCREGYEEDGRVKCKKRSSKSLFLSIALGISVSLLVLVLGSYLIHWVLAKKKLLKQRDQNFEQNGGYMLIEQLSTLGGSVDTTRIFSAEDLKKATNNYHESHVVGEGGFGTVYKGILPPNNREVAIKKSKISDQSQIVQFINEVIVLSQINHRNVVKLLGCCLETEVPMLVYEFITNGNLSEHIHRRDFRPSTLSWEMRLKIAAETAGAIAYLHSATSTPIIHRDIKSTNILLDENYTAKVADFGASKLVPLDHTQLTTLVQGTFGYLDPEYFHSSQLTEKSDVYSFGVLLAELMTGENAISFDRPEKDRNLATYFISSVNTGDSILKIVGKGLLKEGNVEQVKEVAKLTARCLSVKGEERPSMKEVAMELEVLIKMVVEQKWVNKDYLTEQKEMEYLLKQSVASQAQGFISVGGSSSTSISSSSGYSSTIGFDTMRDEMIRKFVSLATSHVNKATLLFD